MAGLFLCYQHRAQPPGAAHKRRATSRHNARTAPPRYGYTATKQRTHSATRNATHATSGTAHTRRQQTAETVPGSHAEQAERIFEPISGQAQIPFCAFLRFLRVSFLPCSALSAIVRFCRQNVGQGLPFCSDFMRIFGTGSL